MTKSKPALFIQIQFCVIIVTYESKYKTDPVKDLYVVTSIQSFEKFVKALQKKLKKLNIQILRL